MLIFWLWSNRSKEITVLKIISLLVVTISFTSCNYEDKKELRREERSKNIRENLTSLHRDIFLMENLYIINGIGLNALEWYICIRQEVKLSTDGIIDNVMHKTCNSKTGYTPPCVLVPLDSACIILDKTPPFSIKTVEPFTSYKKCIIRLMDEGSLRLNLIDNICQDNPSFAKFLLTPHQFSWKHEFLQRKIDEGIKD